MNLFDLQGKAALVTGGNGGIGLGMAQGLARAGARVAIAGRDQSKNAAALKALGEDAIALAADVADERACRAMVDQAAQRLGRLDILVNNAGINIRKQPQEYTLEEWSRVLAANLTSAFVASQAAYAHLKRASAGKIVNIGSLEALKRGLLAAASVAHSRHGASGLYFAELLERLGLADKLKKRIIV
ncbi:MAG TPA: SDR family NAD(P)-dependent oxidoreductase, partial [Burkholderiales bacterium]|nr:SDR family NAD(P)-dependent oxidoreductase [Burkholderiales bacterium]